MLIIEHLFENEENHKAIELGFINIEILDIVHYPQSETNDRITKTGWIYTEYVNLFVKSKQAASGLTPGCTTLEQKQNYVEDFYQNERIRLDTDKINLMMIKDSSWSYCATHM